MEHYENKQIFINDKYKGSGAQKDVPSAHTCVLRLCACVCVCGVFTEKFQFERRGRAIGRMKKPSERGEVRQKQSELQLGHVNCHSSLYFGAGAKASGADAEAWKSLIVDIIFLTALHLFLARHLSTLARIDFHFIAK